MKNVFRVARGPDGKWYGTRNGQEVPIVVTHLAELAAEEVFRLAREEGNARVSIFNAEGERTEERTFAESRTPHRGGSWEQ